MFLLSEFSRFHVADERGERARLDDLAVALLEDDHPPVTLLIYTGADRRRRALDWKDVTAVSREEKEITVRDLGAGREVARDSTEGEVLLTRDVLDALVLDLQNRRATRANDLALEERDGTLRLRAADTSARALLRRLTRGLFFEPPADSLYDWKYVEFLRGDPDAVPSGAGAHLRVARLQPGEIALLSAAVPYMHAAELLKLLPDKLAARVLELMSPERQLQVFEELDEEEAVNMLALMSPDDAADLIGRLDTGAARRYLERMPKERGAAVVELLRYPEERDGLLAPGLRRGRRRGATPSRSALLAQSHRGRPRRARRRVHGRLRDDARAARRRTRRGPSRHQQPPARDARRRPRPTPARSRDVRHGGHAGRPGELERASAEESLHLSARRVFA
jgi:hypothetical protein